jgi:mannose-6-phosphate isomerase-like protein (cupin superfamily)
MIDVYSYEDQGFRALLSSDGWRVGMLRHSVRFSAFTEMERHLTSDEAFILLAGTATLYAEAERVVMEPCKIYNVPQGTWHHIVVSEDVAVLVVENSDISKDNTEKKFLGEEITVC